MPSRSLDPMVGGSSVCVKPNPCGGLVKKDCHARIATPSTRAYPLGRTPNTHPGISDLRPSPDRWSGRFQDLADPAGRPLAFRAYGRRAATRPSPTRPRQAGRSAGELGGCGSRKDGRNGHPRFGHPDLDSELVPVVPRDHRHDRRDRGDHRGRRPLDEARTASSTGSEKARSSVRTPPRSRSS